MPTAHLKLFFFFHKEMCCNANAKMSIDLKFVKLTADVLEN